MTVIYVVATVMGMMFLTSYPRPCSSVNCVCFEKIVEGMVNPLVMEEPKDGSGRLFVTSQDGFIHIYYRNGTKREKPFVDVSHKLSKLKSRSRGLIGSALHPNFAENKRLFIYYTTKLAPDGIDRATLSEVRVSDHDPNESNTTEKVLVALKKPSRIHSGGQLLFDSKDYLYLFNGDGGVQGDPENIAQNKSHLLGKVLRFDVSDPDLPYQIPPENPFVNDPEARPEVYALGVRCGFSGGIDKGDSKTGYGKDRILFGDVGWSKNEELNYLAPDGGGSNYGWRYWQGTFCHYETECFNIPNYIPPVVNYRHDMGNAIIGGSFYRGCRYPGLNGVYFYGDHGFGRVWTLVEDSTQPNGWLNEDLNVCTDCEARGLLSFPAGHVYGFAEDAIGDLYLLNANTSEPLQMPPGGKIFKIIDPST